MASITSRVRADGGTSYQVRWREGGRGSSFQSETFTTEAGRRVGGRKNTSAKPSTTTGVDPKAVREWARSQGIEVNEFGRIPRTIIEKYEAAQ